MGVHPVCARACVPVRVWIDACLHAKTQNNGGCMWEEKHKLIRITKRIFFAFAFEVLPSDRCYQPYEKFQDTVVSNKYKKL